MASSTSRTKPAPVANSGIITDSETGQRHIPSSVRADGTTRKEIKIRPGYRPAEDVEVYKNRTAHAFQTRNTGGVPGAEGLKDEETNNDSSSKTSNKNAKRREARKKAKSEAASGGADGEEKDDATQEAAKVDHTTNQDPAPSKDEADKMETDKKVRKLKKKLREAKELQEKKEKGEKLLHEQFEKVIKINELIRDLDKLGFNADGEPKEP